MAGHLELPDGRTIDVWDGMVLGRVKTCDLPLADAKASRSHARMIVERGVVEIEDLNSSNGTLLNGKPVTRRMLRAGDVIRIGKTEITFREGAAAPSPAPAASERPPAAAASQPAPVESDPLVGGDDLLGEDLLGGANDLMAGDLAVGDAQTGSAQESAPVQDDRPTDQALSDDLSADGSSADDSLEDDLLADDLLADDDFVDAPVAPPQPAPAAPTKRPPAVPESRPRAPKPSAPKPRTSKSAPVKSRSKAVPPVERASPSADSETRGEDSAAKRSDHGVLQFSQQRGKRGGAFRDDIGQTGGAQRALMILGALVIAVVLGYVVFLLSGD